MVAGQAVAVGGVEGLAERIDTETGAVGGEVKVFGAADAGTGCESCAVGVNGTGRGISSKAGPILKGETQVTG